MQALEIPKRTINRPLAVVRGANGGLATRRVRLKSLEQIAVEMGKCYRQARAKQIDTKELGSYIYALSQMAKVVEIGVLEARVKALESAHGDD